MMSRYPKKAEVGSTLILILVILTLFFLMFVFISLTMMMSKPTMSISEATTGVSNLDYAFMKNLENFLSIPFDGALTPRDYLALAEKDEITPEMKEKFRVAVGNFFDLTAKSRVVRSWETLVYNEKNKEFEFYSKLSNFEYYSGNSRSEVPSDMKFYEGEFFISPKVKIRISLEAFA